jgi:hypothetical protein
LKLPAVVRDAGSTGGKAEARSVLIVDRIHDLSLCALSRPLSRGKSRDAQHTFGMPRGHSSQSATKGSAGVTAWTSDFHGSDTSEKDEWRNDSIDAEWGSSASDLRTE